MKVASFNINGVVKRLANLLEWLAEAEPDVVALQEIKCTDAAFPRAELERAGYGAVWRGQGANHGVALLARGVEPVLTRRELPGDPGDREARYIEAAVGGVLIGGLYLPNGNPRPGPKFDFKLRWFERLERYAAELIAADIPALLVGDYNVVPSDGYIYSVLSYRGNALLQPEPRAAFARLLALGWTDAVGDMHPGEAVYTFWDYKRDAWARDAGLRIDHLLVSPALLPRLVDGGVDRAMRGRPDASDHAPAWIELAD